MGGGGELRGVWTLGLMGPRHGPFRPGTTRGAPFFRAVRVLGAPGEGVLVTRSYPICSTQGPGATTLDGRGFEPPGGSNIRRETGSCDRRSSIGLDLGSLPAEYEVVSARTL